MDQAATSPAAASKVTEASGPVVPHWSANRFVVLDGLRGIGAIMVLIIHTS